MKSPSCRVGCWKISEAATRVDVVDRDVRQRRRARRSVSPRRRVSPCPAPHLPSPAGRGCSSHHTSTARLSRAEQSNAEQEQHVRARVAVNFTARMRRLPSHLRLCLCARGVRRCGVCVCERTAWLRRREGKALAEGRERACACAPSEAATETEGGTR